MSERTRRKAADADGSDPIAAAIDAATDGMSERDRRRFGRLVRLGLERMASSAPAEELAADIAPAGELNEDRRLSWAEAFALEPLVRGLNRRALDLVKAFTRGVESREELRREAEAIAAGLDEIELDGLDDDDRRRLQRQVGEARIEIRHVLSDGEGPRSLRAGRIR
jgi:hypothetical protein